MNLFFSLLFSYSLSLLAVGEIETVPSPNLSLIAAPASTPTIDKVAERKLFNGDLLVEYKLNNGLQVLMVPRHQAKILTYQVWFRVGSIDEKLDPKLNKTGLAHLFEHMMFRGSEKYADGRFDELTASLGADRQNATTYYYRTNYYENIPSNQVEKLMELESDRMKNLRLTPEIFEKEKGAVVGELRRHLDTPSRVASEELDRLVFRKAPFQWTVIGTEEEIKGFSHSEAQYFYKTFYAPNNATLIVIGDTDEKTLLPLVLKYYGNMAAQAVPHTPIPIEPEQTEPRKSELTHPQATSDILVVGYPTPSVDTSDAVALSLLQTHLSRGTEARLRKLLVDKGIAVAATANAGAKPDIFSFNVPLAQKHKAEEALKIIESEITAIQKTPISQDSFRRALNQELLSLYDDISDNSSLGNWLGEYLMICGNYMRGFEIIEQYKNIRPQDLKKVAVQYFKKNKQSVVILRPEKPLKQGKK